MRLKFKGVAANIGMAILASVLTGKTVDAQTATPKTIDQASLCIGPDETATTVCLKDLMALHAAEGGRPIGASGLAAMLAQQGVADADKVAADVFKATAPVTSGGGRMDMPPGCGVKSCRP
ncbi:MAG: hypothetical protein KGQ41_04815 [Alphaproteobacteria bacterium]|nr:hypothetical protein [Alphaproteobacteria bacterium]